ncbi:MAG: hypothetical protein HQK50_04735 [Oligoflexia bacterium]|nr:hypothetical protein [Oligoflexia bacterium]
MKIFKQLVFLLIMLNYCTIVYSIEIPELQEILDAQSKCDSSIFYKYNWEDSSLYSRLAQNRTIIVASVIIKSLPFQPPGKKFDNGNDWGQKNSEEDQTYRLSYRMLSAGTYDISCDDSEVLIKKMYDKDILLKNKIEDSFEDNDFFIRYTRNKKFAIERDGSDEEFYSIYPSALKPISPVNRKISGLVCMIQIEDFIKNKNAINVDKLCEGQPQRKKELMKWALNNLHEFYKVKYPGWKKTAKPDRK